MAKRGKSGSFLSRAMEAATEKFGQEITQTQLGKLAGGITQPSVALWATSTPKIERGIALAGALGVCVQWLYDGNGPKHPWDQQEIADAALRSALEMANTLSPEALLAWLGTGEFIRKQHGGRVEPPADESDAKKKRAD